MTDTAPVDEPASRTSDDGSRAGSTLLGVMPRAARERARESARGSRPLSAAPTAHDAAPRQAIAGTERDDHEEVWTQLDTLRPQATRGATKRLARIARGLAAAAIAAICLAALGFVVTRTFFFFSQTWIVPAVVPATDERVVALQRDLANHERARDRLAAEVAATARAIAKARPKSVELARAIERRDAIAASLAERDRQIAEVRSSPYLRAAAGGAVMAVAPHGNLDGVGAGTPVYACKLQMVWCREVGAVVDVLRGDVALEHPHRDQQLVGRMLELRLDDRDAEQAEVLFLGGAPLWM